MRSGWTDDDIHRLADAAITAGLAERARRGLLLARLAREVQAALPDKERPADQLRSDLTTLAGLRDPRPLDGWLAEARAMARPTHPVESHLFERYRRRRHALLIGGGGRPAPTWVKSALLDAAQLVGPGLGDLAIGHVARHDAAEGGVVLDLVEQYTVGPESEALWLHLAGEVFEERRRLRLRSADRQGLQLAELAEWMRDARSACTVVIVETPGADDSPASDAMLDAIFGLDWGAPALLAVGPGVGAALAEAMSVGGALSGRALVAAMPSGVRARGTDAIVSHRRRGADAIPSDPHQAATVEYLEGLRANCRPLPFERRNAGVGCLGDVYVPLYTLGRDDPESSDLRKRGFPSEAEPPQTMHDRVAVHRHIFMVGEPGSGKTTTLRQLCEMLCDAHLAPDAHPPPPWVPSRPLPVWLDLRELPANGERTAAALLDFAFGRLPRQNTTERLPPVVARDALREGRAVLILDGLDEVPDPQHRIEWARAIAELARVQAAGNRVWVSCRGAAAAAGAEPRDTLVRVDLQPFDDAQRAEVIRRWLTARLDDPGAVEAEAEALAADLARHPRVDTETGSPLLLALVCLLYFDRRRLPDSRVELYEQLIDLLLRNRERAIDPAVADISVQHRRDVLTDLAMTWWHEIGSKASTDATASRGIAEDDCVRILADGLRSRRTELDDAERFRRAVALVKFFDLRAGLLRWTSTGPGGRRQLGFAHRTFAEYLVASRLGESETARTDHLSERLARDANWREVFVLFTAQVSASAGTDPKPAWDWVEQLARWAADGKKAAEHRAAYARLAAECLEPCRDRPPPAETAAAVDGLQAVLLDAARCAGFPAVHRAAFWQAIGMHNRLVCGDAIDRWVHIPGGDFWRGAAEGDEMAFDDEKPGGMVTLPDDYHIHRWPVLVWEYARFVDGGGYGVEGNAPPPWWSPAGWQWRLAQRAVAPDRWAPQHRGRPTHPVVGVSYFEAEAYAAWLATVGEGPPGVVGAPGLPSELEWERAARGGGVASARRRYPWGWDDDPERRNGGAMLRGTNALGAFPGGRSPDGAWAMSGNVWEWCCSPAIVSYAEPGAGMPSWPESGRPHRVVRGGGWDLHPQSLRVSYRVDDHPASRVGDLPAYRGGDVGFRCVWRARPPRSLGA